MCTFFQWMAVKQRDSEEQGKLREELHSLQQQVGQPPASEVTEKVTASGGAGQGGAAETCHSWTHTPNFKEEDGL